MIFPPDNLVDLFSWLLFGVEIDELLLENDAVDVELAKDVFAVEDFWFSDCVFIVVEDEDDCRLFSLMFCEQTTFVAYEPTVLVECRLLYCNMASRIVHFQGLYF